MGKGKNLGYIGGKGIKILEKTNPQKTRKTKNIKKLHKNHIKSGIEHPTKMGDGT